MWPLKSHAPLVPSDRSPLSCHSLYEPRSRAPPLTQDACRLGAAAVHEELVQKLGKSRAGARAERRADNQRTLRILHPAGLHLLREMAGDCGL